MAWNTLVDRQGRGWAFDIDGAAHIIRSCMYNRELVQRSRLVQRDHGFLMPTTTEVETNFSGIRQAVQNSARATVNQLSRDIMQDPRRLYEWLVDVRMDGERAGEAHHRLMRQASRASVDAIARNVDNWENALAVTKFVRDASAGAMFVAATVLTGGAAAAVGAGATALTFAANTEDNIAQNQSMNQALRNATIATTFAVATNLLVPKALGAAGQRMLQTAARGGQAATRLNFTQSVALGVVSSHINIAADAAKTILTSDTAIGPVQQIAQQQLQRQLGRRRDFEIGAMVFQSWLASRGVPAVAFLRNSQNNENVLNSVTGGMLAAIGDRLVAAVDDQGRQGAATRGDLDMILPQIQRAANAEQYVRESAMRPA